MGRPFYITTAISYPNGKPHIGHAYEAIAADAIARFQKMRGRDVRLVTGTDEHGLKMVQAARDAKCRTQDFANEISSYFREMYNVLNVSYERFVRTTEPAHHRASSALWKAMASSGDLYLGRYEGWYSVRDEAFYDESELLSPESPEGDEDKRGESKNSKGSKERLSPQGTPVEWTAEETWFFKLSAYQDRLLALYHEQPGFIRPESRRNEIMRFVEGNLKDLSVSRTSFDWGVKVPESADHVMYVWVDALTAYMTGVGFPDQSGDFARYWPADIHLIGKDIIRFHAVYWPAFLMSANLPLPKQVFGHGFLLNRGRKMSKSVGNVVDPIVLAETLGVDALRYYLLREISFGQDGSYSLEAIVETTNSDLANSFGNLAQRSLSMIFKNMQGILEKYTCSPADAALQQKIAQATLTEIPHEWESLNFSAGIKAWLHAVFACNQYIDEQAPWTLKTSNPQRMKAVLMTLFKAIRDLTIVIRPIIPASADNLLDQMGIAADERDFVALRDSGEKMLWFDHLVESGFTLSQPQPLFPRLESPTSKPKTKAENKSQKQGVTR